MYLAYVSGLGIERNETDLCLVAEKPDLMTVPVRIRDLKPTRAAMHRIGPEEAVTVISEGGDRSLVVTPLSGSIFLTPNLPQSPGYRAKRIRLLLENNDYRTFYDRDRGGWEEWIANRERT